MFFHTLFVSIMQGNQINGTKKTFEKGYTNYSYNVENKRN